MESDKTKQSEQGQVSAQDEGPKDLNQNTYTEKEISLAEKYKVEPKLVRLLKEIAEEHFAEPEQVETQDQSQEGESQPSTGIPYLDELIQSATYPGIAMAYTCLQASWINNELGDKLSATLRSSVNELLERHRKGDRQLDAECEVLPAIKWLAFLKGLRVSDDQETESLQPKKATPITVLQNWLSKRGYAEKLTAVLLWQLLNKEDAYKKEGYCEGKIGNELFKEYEQAVVDASQDKEYLTTADPEEVSVTGLVTGLLPMRV